MVENRMPALWQAKWVDPELSHEEKERQPASVLRRRFTVNSTENAVLYITCHGLYEAELNGQRVGEFVLAPGEEKVFSIEYWHWLWRGPPYRSCCIQKGPFKPSHIPRPIAASRALAGFRA